MTTYTEALFEYAGHTMRLKLWEDSAYATQEETAGIMFEVASLGGRVLIEDGRTLGVYPEYFAESEAMESLTNVMVCSKRSPRTLGELEAQARGYIKQLIGEGMFDKVAN